MGHWSMVLIFEGDDDLRGVDAWCAMWHILVSTLGTVGGRPWRSTVLAARTASPFLDAFLSTSGFYLFRLSLPEGFHRRM